LRRTRIGATGTGLAKRIEFVANIPPDEVVPEVDEAYVLGEELAGKEAGQNEVE
jgi:hypothetical protein